MSIDEYYAPVTHKHNNCPICDNVALIQDVVPVHSAWDRFIASANQLNATVRIMTGKRIEVREER